MLKNKTYNARVCANDHDLLRNDESKFYMGWHNNQEVLKGSSSGGAFTAFAQYVLARGGVVFGAEMDEMSHKITHACVNSVEELQRIRLSKYYQSNPGTSYREAQALLEKGTFVLYTGTACQIAGLYSYLGKDYDNLITVDVLCHGVGSKNVIESYIVSKENTFKKKVKRLFFRYKDSIIGWQLGGGTRMKLEFTDGSVYIAQKQDDTFFLGFNKNFFLRESCYRCDFCGTKRVADFTIGDFWGCNREEVTDEQMKMGISLILVNSNKAQKMFSELKEYMQLMEIEPSEAIPYNRALEKPNLRPKFRDKFYKTMSHIGYDRTIKFLFWKHFLKIKLKKIGSLGKVYR